GGNHYINHQVHPDTKQKCSERGHWNTRFIGPFGNVPRADQGGDDCMGSQYSDRESENYRNVDPKES
ncbi:MAG: hypothetical protein VCB79_02765, partial [Dehalococcoidia bacterium]